MTFWKLNCRNLNISVFYMIFVIIIEIRLFSKAFQKFGLNLTIEPLKKFNHLTTSAISLKITF